MCVACEPLTACTGGQECGTEDDLCGGTVECGTCASGEICDVDDMCVCAPITECTGGQECGTEADLCDGTIECGTCDSEDSCVEDMCVCIPTTTACSEGAECGVEIDECGGDIPCNDTCNSDNETCSSENLCVLSDCTPTTDCTTEGAECGSIVNDCGDTIDCTNTCGSVQTCNTTTNMCGPELTYEIDLDEYGISVYDVSEVVTQELDPDTLEPGLKLEIRTIMTMDTQGKLTGIEELWLIPPNSADNDTLLVTAELKGTAKRGANQEKQNLKVKYKAKDSGELDGIKLTMTNQIKKELVEGAEANIWNGEQKLKLKLKGVKTYKEDIPIADDSGLSGEAEVAVLLGSDGKNGIAGLYVEDSDYDLGNNNTKDGIYSLNAKGYNTNNKGLKKVKCTGTTEKGLTVKLKIDEKIVTANEENGGDAPICEKIDGKVLGQKLKFKR
jgi:hypothetical protein